MQTTTDPEPRRSFYRRLAQHAGLAFVTLDPARIDDAEFHEINPLAARLLSEQICRYHRMLPVSYANGVVTIATPEPFDQVAREVATALTGRSVRFVVTADEDIDVAIDRIFEAMPGEAPGGRVTEPNYPTRVGDLLVARGLATDEEVREALEEQERTGSRVGDILVHAGIVREAELVAILAEQFQLPLVDLSEYEPDPAALELIPEPLARHLRAVPIAVDETTLYLAIADVLDDDTVAALREHTHLELRGFLTARNSIDELLQRVHGQEYVTVARSELLTRFPEESANRVLSNEQRVFFIVLLIIMIAALALAPVVTIIVLIAFCSVFYTAT